MRRTSQWFLVLAITLGLFLPAAVATPALAAATPVFINEIHYDNDGTDSGEAIEIAGPAGTDLTGWSLVLYNGSGGAVYDTDILNVTVPDQQGGYGTVVMTYDANGIQNGAPDGVALVDSSNNVIQFLSYEGTFTAVDGPANGMLSVDIGVSEPSDAAVGSSLQLSGTGAVYEDFTWSAPAANTFGAVNNGQTFGGEPAGPVAVINELDADNVSSDSAEFIELYDGGTGHTSLDGLVLVLYNGSTDVSYNAFDLDGRSTNAAGYFVLCGNAVNVANCDWDVTPDTDLIQNGQDAAALYVGDATSFPIGTAVTLDNLIDAIVYDTDDADDAGLLVLLNPGQPQVNENANGAGTIESNQRCPNGSGGARNTDTYAQFAPTPGAANLCGADIAPTVVSTSPTSDATGVAVDASISVTFSEDVTVAESWHEISCTASGAHAATVSGGPATFTLDPTVDFANGETCMVTVYAAQVADQDGTPDNLTADYVWSFTTAEPAGPSVIINEVDADTPGSDAAEFVELFDGGTGNTSLDGLVVVFYNGSNDLSYAAYDLDGYMTDANGYFLLGNTALTPDITFAGNFLQNGQDAVALYQADATDFPTGTSVTTTNLIDAIAYDTSDADDPGLLVLLNAGQPQVDENANGNGATESNQRCPNGSGGARNTDTYDQWAPTARAANTCMPPPEACGDPFTPIYDVQGNGMTSPLNGAEVAVEGIVVGDFQNNESPDDGNLNGFHIQDPAGDGNAATSDGVFIYARDPMDVKVGDAVRVRGKVSEYNGMTEITASKVWICSTGNSVTATPLSLPVASVDDFEPYEGMLVTFPQALVIAEYFNFDRYGEIVLTSKRHLTPTAEFEPGLDAMAAAQAYLLDRITLDDGRTNQNPDPAIHPNGDIFDLTNLFRGGDTVSNVTGVLDYSFGLYRIQPVEGADYSSVNPRTAQPNDVGGSLKVASFNVLNYFTTIDTGDWICGPLEDQECRGADSAEEFARQRAKIIAALSAIDADVVGLIEIENHPFDVPTADLVAGLNDVMGAGTYDYIVTNAIGTDAIRQALIYKPAAVTPWGGYAVLNEFVDPRFLDDYNRPVLAQSFVDKATGGIFTVAVNHLKSKGSPCDAIGDPDLGDGAGNCNLTRKTAAEALVDWLATDPTDSGDTDALIIGDLNSYDKEDPIDVLVAGGYTDLVYAFEGEYAYSYVFDGQVGYLDHALANASLLDQVTGTTAWHINADEPDLIDYDMSFKLPAQDALWAPDPYRSSDHDPVIVGLNLKTEATESFVTGGGWFNSPAGAFPADPAFTGQVDFTLNVKYKKGEVSPKGNDSLIISAYGFEFYSTGYDGLVINDDGTLARYQGVGMVNGMPAPNGLPYRFRVWAGDGDPDALRFKIWYDDGGERIVYDNVYLQAIDGGSIQIHQK